jgi:hypothetical protein
VAVEGGSPGKGFKIADAYVEIHTDDDSARKAVKDLPAKVGPDADRAGREIGKRVGKGVGEESSKSGTDAGGKLSKGMELAIVRNSPLIAAAVGGALALGAPAALVGAQALFGTIGIVAASQSVEVRSAWSRTWDGMVEDTVSASEPIQRVLIRLADDVDARFEELAPRLGGAFRDAAPLVEEFSDGLLDAAENALPGLFRAIYRGQPVVEGFSSFLRDTGTGLSGFFDNMSEHAPAAGRAFEALGRIMGAILPTLGTLLGQGAELASVVLPPIADVLEIVADAAQALGPLLPPIVLGFAALKIAQNAAGWVGSLGEKLTDIPDKLRGINVGTAAFAGALALFAIGYQEATSLGQKWAEQLREGGDAADEAGEKLSNFGAAMEGIQSESGVTGWLAALGGLATTIGMTSTAMKEGKEAQEEYLASLDPAEEAAERARIAEEELARAILEHGAGSREARDAQREYEDATRENEAAQAELEMALHGVTAAMIEQANQAFAAIDANFAYENAVDRLNGLQEDYNAAVRDHGSASEEAIDAMAALQEQGWQVAQSYGAQQAALSGLEEGTAEYDRLIQTETLAMLYQLRERAGPEMAAALTQQINMLEASGISLNETGHAANATAERMRDLGLSVRQIPGQKGVVIDAPTADQKKRIQDLGYTIITLPNKQVIVSADASSAYATLNAFVLADAVKRVPIIGFLAGSAAAEGGATDDLLGIPRYDGGGATFGVGGPKEDRNTIRVSPGEHIFDFENVQAMGGQANVYRFRQLLDRGAINVPDLIRAAAGADRSAPAVQVSTGSGSGKITVEQLIVQLTGVVDLANLKETVGKLAPAIRDALRDLEVTYR